MTQVKNYLLVALDESPIPSAID